MSTIPVAYIGQCEHCEREVCRLLNESKKVIGSGTIRVRCAGCGNIVHCD